MSSSIESAPDRTVFSPQDFSAFNSPGAYAAYVRDGAGQLKEADLIVNGMHCAGCVGTVEQGLREAGASAAEVNIGTHRARVLWDERQVRLGTLLQSLHRLGYPAHPYDPATQERMHREARRWAMTRLGVAAFGAANSMLYSVGLYAGYFYGMDQAWHRLFQGITAWIAMPVVLFSGWPFLRGAWGGLRAGRITMDGLISLGLLSALIYSWIAYLAAPGLETYFESVTMGVFVLLIGRSLEILARARMGSATEALLALQARWATRLEARDGGTVEAVVPVHDLRPGDRLLVRMGEVFPTDGVVLDAETEADESALTGESRPRLIPVGGTVLGGTVNTGVAAVIESRRVGAESVLGRIARLVDHAQQHKAPVQRIADRVAGHFALAVLALAGGTLGYWLWIATAAPPQPAWAIAITVLIIACPCGLGLATPMAVLAANALAARRGILIKGGEALERAAQVTDVVLDKTGTLTTGGLSVQEVRNTGGLPRARWLALAAAVERRVVHPLSGAILAAWQQAGAAAVPATLPVAEDVRVLPGRGAAGRVQGAAVLVGSWRLLAEQGVDLPPPPPDLPVADTLVYVAVAGQVQGVLRLSDPLRPDAALAIAALQALGLRVHLFSGDGPGVVESISRRLRIADARGGMLPEDKLRAIAALQADGGVVAMVGDGINDGPALARADVGIALGTGSDLALETAGVLLLRPRLQGVLETLLLARRAYAVIRQNLALSVLYNLCAIPLAMAGWVIPLVAAVSMSLSSLVVVLNALRLRLWGQAWETGAPQGTTAVPDEPSVSATNRAESAPAATS